MWLALLLCAVVLGLLANMTFVIVSRTALVTMPVMLAVFAVLYLRWRTSLMILVAAVALADLSWMRHRSCARPSTVLCRSIAYTRTPTPPTSVGLRLEFWRKSMRFIAEAPLAGHGTGSTRGLFERAAVGSDELATGKVVGNPHNQTLNVAVQWGAIGVVVLWAMWLSHLLLFRGEGLVAWIGLLVVVQNILTSLFNSHLFDFHEGWMYVLGRGRRRRDGAGRARAGRCAGPVALASSAGMGYQRPRSDPAKRLIRPAR